MLTQRRMFSMDINSLKQDLALKNKNGVSFLSAGTVVWCLILIIFILDVSRYTQNLFMLYATGVMFPLSILLSKWLNVDWQSKGHPLGSLALVLNVAQFLYFPMMFWAFFFHPDDMMFFFALITAAHFFPYGWLYDNRIFYLFSPLMVLVIFSLGFCTSKFGLWLIPAGMVCLLFIFIALLWNHYKKKKA